MQASSSVETLGGSFRILVAAGLTVCAIGAVIALLLLAGGAVIDGSIAAFLVFLIFRAFWRATHRKRELLRRGYHPGRRVGTHWVYEELHGRDIVALELVLEYVGSGEYDLHVPGERDWMTRMPAWARERRAEIVERLETVFKRSQLHFDPDTPSESS